MRDIVQQTAALDPQYKSYLRFVEADDAEYIVQLRSNQELSRYLTASPADVEKQRQWILNYKERERQGQEFYFVIMSERLEHGVVRMYDFREIDGEPSFSWGSWIIPPPRPSGLVTFSAITMYEIGFDALRLPRAHFEVVKGNTGVVAFHERAGAVVESEDEEKFYFRYLPANYQEFRARSEPQIKQHRQPWPPQEPVRFSASTS
ncbi:MAG: GNAT family N-acetyltransferase [Acetobacteraceae bacterium]|nr:GNAT family N-acetyltransferase [Acetobacteraceae bacterium]